MQIGFTFLAKYLLDSCTNIDLFFIFFIKSFRSIYRYLLLQYTCKKMQSSEQHLEQLVLQSSLSTFYEIVIIIFTLFYKVLSNIVLNYLYYKFFLKISLYDICIMLYLWINHSLLNQFFIFREFRCSQFFIITMLRLKQTICYFFTVHFFLWDKVYSLRF